MDKGKNLKTQQNPVLEALTHANLICGSNDYHYHDRRQMWFTYSLADCKERLNLQVFRFLHWCSCGFRSSGI
jgi:hypothetical protein